MLPMSREQKLANDPIKMQLSGIVNIGILCFTLFTAASIINLRGDNSISTVHKVSNL